MDGQPKTAKEAVDRMQYFSSICVRASSKQEAVRAMANKNNEAVDNQKDGEGKSEVRDLKSRIQQLENALRESSKAPVDLMSPSPRGGTGHFRR